MTLEAPEQLLTLLAAALQLLLEGLSVATVLLGLVLSLWGQRGPLPAMAAVRLRFGSWLSLALEFQLGADIVATTTSPNRDHLIQLAVVAVIRTFLNLFLARELEEERRVAAERRSDAARA